MAHPSQTRKPNYDITAALAHLTAADPKLARLIARAGSIPTSSNRTR